MDPYNSQRGPLGAIGVRDLTDPARCFHFYVLKTEQKYLAQMWSKP